MKFSLLGLRKVLIPLVLLVSIAVFAQDSARVIEPRETSTENYDLLPVALIGLALLIALYFFFRKTRKRN